jgi:hypothetical protein
MRGRRGILTLVAVLLMALVAGPTAGDAAKKKKAPCDFKLARNKADHTRVRIKMTCHKKLVVNIRFTLKKHKVKTFNGFPGAQCSIQSQRTVGCVYGNGAPLNKPVSAVVGIDLPAFRHEKRFTRVEMFLSGGDPIGEQLGY